MAKKDIKEKLKGIITLAFGVETEKENQEGKANLAGIGPEATDAYAKAALDEGLELKKEFSDVRVIKTWFTNNDHFVCDICRPLNGVNVEVEKPFIGGDGKEYDRPSACPDCRCWIKSSTDILGETELQNVPISQ
ncbi:MAG: hypothetical protein Q7J07_04570 [Pelolinea sp.]|nr:hypothetical protein [Pelolinea sp.]